MGVLFTYRYSTIRLRTAYDTPVALYLLNGNRLFGQPPSYYHPPFSLSRKPFFVWYYLSHPSLLNAHPSFHNYLWKWNAILFILPYLLLPHSVQVNSPPLPLSYPSVVFFYLQIFILPTKSSTLAYSLLSSLFTRYPSLLAFTNLLIGVCR